MCGLFVIGIGVAHLVVQSRDVGTAAFLSGWRTIGTLVVLIVTTSAIMPLIGLTGYHCRLIWLGRTTIEMVRAPVGEPGEMHISATQLTGLLAWGPCDRSGQSTRQTRMDPTRAVRPTHTATLRGGTTCSGRSAGRWTCTLAFSHTSMRARMPERRILHSLDLDGKWERFVLHGRAVRISDRQLHVVDTGHRHRLRTLQHLHPVMSAGWRISRVSLESGTRDAFWWRESSRAGDSHKNQERRGRA